MVMNVNLLGLFVIGVSIVTILTLIFWVVLVTLVARDLLGFIPTLIG